MRQTKTKLILFFALAILLSLHACAPKELLVDISYAYKEVSLAVGGKLTVILKSEPETDYVWDEIFYISDKTVMQQIDHQFQPPATTLLSDSGKDIWTLQALKAGKVSIYTGYRCPYQ